MIKNLKSPSTNCMTNFQICLYTYEPCLPKGSDCPVEGGGVGLSGGRGGKGVPWILETGPGPPTDYVQIMYIVQSMDYKHTNILPLKYAHIFLRKKNFRL